MVSEVLFAGNCPCCAPYKTTLLAVVEVFAGIIYKPLSESFFPFIID
jgi:hypothetical protein